MRNPFHRLFRRIERLRRLRRLRSERKAIKAGAIMQTYEQRPDTREDETTWRPDGWNT